MTRSRRRPSAAAARSRSFAVVLGGGRRICVSFRAKRLLPPLPVLLFGTVLVVVLLHRTRLLHRNPNWVPAAHDFLSPVVASAFPTLSSQRPPRNQGRWRRSRKNHRFKAWIRATKSKSSSSSSSTDDVEMEIPGTTRKPTRKNIRFITNKMCPYAQKVWIALETAQRQQQIVYKLEEISLYGPNGKPSWFWKLNPAGTVPVMVVLAADEATQEKDLVLTDSDECLDYLHQLLESSSTDDCESANSRKAQIDKWRKDWINEQLLPIGKRAMLQPSKANQQRLNNLLHQLDQEVGAIHAAGHDYLVVGSNDTTTTTNAGPSVADCHAFPFLWRLASQEEGHDNFSPDAYPHIHSWLSHCSRQQPFRITIQPNWWWWW